ncbi:MAG: hypothetical protein MJ182_06010 [Treponema sp.]|nr:hypothetical protein [Treponema sp.]
MAYFFRGLSLLNKKLSSTKACLHSAVLLCIFKRLLLVCVLCILNVSFCFASDIRFHLWAQRDAYPESAEAQDLNSGAFDYPIKMMKETAPFLVNGMVYGWNFVYTPSDKARGVQEFFELTEIQPQEKILKNIIYEYPWISEENNRLNCWVRFVRDEFQENSFKLWSSIQNPVINGRGYGDLTKGFEGIKDAVTDAVKDAVRQHYRNEIKNKPKEITGSVIIRKNPTLGIVSGKYVINLDFFLESGRIITYSVF